jgi:CheY-like chemotaxis protein
VKLVCYVPKGPRCQHFSPIVQDLNGINSLFVVSDLAKPRREPDESNRVRILAIEDHETTLYILMRILERRGFAVVGASSVEAALRAANDNEFDIVISDLGLPDGNGQEAFAAIKIKQDRVRGIAISGFGTAEDIRSCLAVGFDSHITKPVTVDAVEKAIADLCIPKL